MNIFKIILVTILVGAFAGGAVAYGIIKTMGASSNNDLIREFYLVENAAHVSPHSLRKMMDQGNKNFILIDLRSPQEYSREHIIGAINIPTYKNPNTSISLEHEQEEKERIINEFKALDKSKEIITYCYSAPCMTGRKVGKLLALNGIYVKTLNIGWNEWRYFWDLWNHDAETKVNPTDYIISGEEPGEPKMRELPPACGKGELSC